MIRSLLCILALSAISHSLFAQQDNHGLHDGKAPPIPPGSHIRLLLSDTTESPEQSDSDRITGTVTALSRDTVKLKTDNDAATMEVPVGTIRKLELSRGPVSRKRNGFRFAGAGLLIGGVGAYGIGEAVSDGPLKQAYLYIGLGAVGGAVNGYALGACGRRATFGFLGGAALGAIIGASSSKQMDLPTENAALLGAGVLGQLGLLAGAVWGALSDPGERWQTISLDKIDFSIILHGDAGMMLTASIDF